MCDNTDCEENGLRFFDVVLREEFENDKCVWCNECVAKDLDMIKEIKETEPETCEGCGEALSDWQAVVWSEKRHATCC